MGFSLIERYIFRRALVAVLTAAAGLIGVLWVVRAVQTVDVIMNKGQGILTYLQMTTLGVPTLAAAIAPLALLIGLIRTTEHLNDESELVVMHASGASRLSLLKPYLALSLLVAITVYFLHLWAGPTSMQTLRKFVTEMRADLVSLVVQEGTFQDVGSGLTFHVASRSPGGGLNGVLIVDGRRDKETLTYLASEGGIAQNDGQTYLVLKSGQIQRLENETKALSVVKFNSYAFNLSSFSGGKGDSGRSQMEISTAELLNPDPEDPMYQLRPGRFRAELHTRLTGGLYPLMVGLLILAYIGTPNSHRQSQTLVITAACLLILVLRGTTIVAEGALRTNENALFVVWLVPLLTMAVASYLLATDRSAFPPELVTKTEALIARLATFIEPVVARVRGYRANRSGDSQDGPFHVAGGAS